MSEKIFVARKVVKRYKRNNVLNKLDMEICRGNIYGFVGRNGAGKTTLMRILTGRARQTEGEIEIFGEKNPAKLHMKRKNIGAVVEGPAFYSNMTAKDNLEVIRLQCGIKDKGCINELLKYGIEPIITTIHFDMPLWVVKKYNGFVNRQVISLYQHYIETIVNRYHDRVKYWISYCEINVMNHALYMVGGTVLKESEDRDSVLLQCAYHKLIGNAILVRTCHEVDKDLKVGCEVAGTPTYPLTSSPLDYQLMMNEERRDKRFTDVMVKGKIPYYFRKELNDHGIDILEEDENLFKNNTLDFIAVSYYKTSLASHEGVKDNPLLETTPFGWTIDPKGMRIMLNKMYERYEVPIMIVENGLGTYDKIEDGKIHDDYRIDYLSKHIEQMEKAMDDGVEVIGYLTWAAMDVVSTSEGMMSKRYGFIYVDRNDDGSGTLKRYPKD